MSPTARDFLLHSGVPKSQFVVKVHRILLTLNNQLDGTDIPIFDDATPVSGFVELERWEGTEKIEVELHGVVNIHEYGGLKTKSDVLRDTRIIWDASREPEARVPFEFSLARRETERLPPTYQARVGAGDAHDVNGFDAAVSYSITVRAHEQHTSLLEAIPGHTGDVLDHKLTVPFIFVSRLRSPHKGLPAAATLAGSTPGSDGIARSEHTLRNASDNLEPIHATVDIPEPNIFSLRHPIPVVLRIRGSELTFARVQAKLQRLSIIVLETPMTDPEIIGEVELQKIPTSATSDRDDLVFAGDVHIYDHITAGTFVSNKRSVHDFLVIQIVPPSHEQAALLKDSRISIPINLTTD